MTSRRPDPLHRSPLTTTAVLAFAGFLPLIAAGPVAAQSPAVLEAESGLGRMDPTPSATLLLPYFETDPSNPAHTTLFTIHNAFSAPVLAHVTLWTDWSIPIIDFDVYLTGFDAQSFDLADIFTTGTLPDTGPVVSNQGDLSLPNTAPASCDGQLPVGDLLPVQLQLLNDAHTGNAVVFPGEPGNECWGQSYGDGVARGFVTIDVVDECSVDFPNTPGYFDIIAGDDNVIWGDWTLLDPGSAQAYGGSLVHLEADPDAFLPGDYSFYGRYVSFDSSDGREPLPTSWAARYLDLPASGLETDLIVWRDPKADPQPVVCGGSPPLPFPLEAEQAIVFDEEENPEQPASSLLAFPLATQRVPVGQAALPTTSAAGWIYLDLDHDVPSPPPMGVAQSWVTVLTRLGSVRGVGREAVPLDNALLPRVPPGSIFGDGFESGDLSAWSSSVPLQSIPALPPAFAAIRFGKNVRSGPVGALSLSQ